MAAITLSCSLNGFQAAIRTFRFRDSCSDSNSKQSDMRNCVQILSRPNTVYPEPFLTGVLESGIIPFSFRAQSINHFEGYTFAINGKTVIIRNCHIFGAAAAFLPLFQFLWSHGQTADFERLIGQRYFCRFRPLSVDVPSLCIARPASQMG